MDDRFLILAAVVLGGYGVYRIMQQSSSLSPSGAFPLNPPQSSPGLIPPYSQPVSGGAGSGASSVSANGQARIKRFETLKLTPYWDVNGYSVGWGHHIPGGQRGPSPITQAMAQTLFNSDINNVESFINSHVHAPLTQNEYDAIADLVFNIGGTELAPSHIIAYLNAGNYSAASAEFPKWVHSGGRTNPQLVSRRASDRALFNQGMLVA